jgi:type IV pilus assembly protein PilA
MKKQQGFTLIELMIVVAIIAILAAIAISQYQDYVIRSQVSEGSSLADGTKTAVAEFYNNYGRFRTDNASYGLAPPASISGKYVTQVDVGARGQIAVTFGRRRTAAIRRGDRWSSRRSRTAARSSGPATTQPAPRRSNKYRPTPCRD